MPLRAGATTNAAMLVTYGGPCETVTSVTIIVPQPIRPLMTVLSIAAALKGAARSDAGAVRRVAVVGLGAGDKTVAQACRARFQNARARPPSKTIRLKS